MERKLVNVLSNYINEKVCIQGWIYKIRKLKSITFVILRDRSGLVQCILDNKKFNGAELTNESVISIEGIVKESKNILNPFEVEVQNIIVNAFREFLNINGFTEINTPKIVKEGAEGGTEVFEVKYFENKAYLAQSPQFYEQMMVGAGFERVFEIGHAYRAEEHNTNRHLNEYVSMDLEMGFIEDERDVMIMEEELLKYIIESLKKHGKEYIEILDASIPEINGEIPRIDFNEALEILKREYNKNDLDGDLDPEAEKLLYKYSKEKLNSEFLFLTNYPRKKRPMYTMPKGEHGTHSFDLLFRGIEITTGGQRIHNYDMLVENMMYKGFESENYESYLEAFKFGMPKHGGLAIGLERITAKILEIENVREATLFPRDRKRLIP